MDLQLLTASQGPAFHLLAAPAAEACDALGALESTPALRCVTRFLRADRARTGHALLDECAAALQFPPYFGDNWDALHDCLTDLAWLRADVVVLCFTEASQLLIHATEEDRQRLVLVLHEAVKHWSKTKPFHVVWQVQPGEEDVVAAAWKARGLHFSPLR